LKVPGRGELGEIVFGVVEKIAEIFIFAFEDA
jgi:hypothetical protein